MQFKYPEILYILFALLIPIFIHLFQLQRFIKTPFTNVKFLKEIELQTRKSSRLKKWLVLISRLAIFASIIIAFAQPYFSKNNTTKEWFTTIYIDNSISMQAKGEQGELFKRAVQDIVEHLPNKGQFALATNAEIHTNLSKKSLIEQLKNIPYSSLKTSLKTQVLKSQQVFEEYSDKHKKLIIISDFQNALKKNQNLENTNENSYLFSKNTAFDYIQLTPQLKYNISIDSVSILERNIDNTVLEIVLFNQGNEDKSVSVNALQNKIVLAKNTVEMPANTSQKLALRIPNKVENITLKIDADDAYFFDNVYYVSFQKQSKVNVLVISEYKSFFEKIYTPDEFNLTQKKLEQISFSQIDKQQLVVLNGLLKIPQSLQTKLESFTKNGGSLLIIPNKKNTIDDLNGFFNQLRIGQLIHKQTDSIQVTKIHFSHPILRKVFDKKITNFQYPIVTSYFKSKLINEQPILSFENQESFICQFKKQKGNVFWVAAPLDSKSSNFTKAPLIVPIIYNIGKHSLSQPQLSYRTGEENTITVKKQLNKDEVLHITKDQYDFIPLQEIQSEKVLLFTDKQPQKAGFYEVTNKENILKNLAFNNPKDESNLVFLEMNRLTETNENIHQYTSIKEALSALSAEQSIQSYFKWFVLLAFLFILIEILLLKYL